MVIKNGSAQRARQLRLRFSYITTAKHAQSLSIQIHIIVLRQPVGNYAAGRFIQNITVEILHAAQHLCFGLIFAVSLLRLAQGQTQSFIPRRLF